MHVWVGPISLEIVISKKVRTHCGEECAGAIDLERGIIEIEEGLDPQYQDIVLWHEVVHAIRFLAGTVVPEEAVACLASGIVDVLRRNPDMRLEES